MAPKDPRIRFGTKDEHNARREKEFLALSPQERFSLFLQDIVLDPPDPSELGEAKGNFIIEKKRTDGVRS
jgi:hypothetical protein